MMMDIRLKLKAWLLSAPIVTLFLVFVSALLYGFKFPAIVPDMAWYIGHAYSIVQGYGLSGPDLTLDRFDVLRGPVFPLMISAALMIDQSPEAAFWVVKTGAIALPPTVFLFCYQLQQKFGTFPSKDYGILWGVFTVIGIFSVAEINKAAEWHLDAWWVLFCLWSLMALMHALTAGSLVVGCVAGLLWATGYLTKEASILYLAVLILLPLVVTSFRKLRNVKVMVAFLLSAALPICLWFYYLVLRLGNYEFLGAQGGNVLSVLVDYLLTPEVSGLLAPLFAFQELIFLTLGNPVNGVLSVVVFGWLFLLAWIICSIRAIRFDDARVVLLASGVAIPLLAYNALQGYGFRHGISFYIFAAPAFGYLVVQTADLLARKRFSRTALWALFLVAIWAGLQYKIPNTRGYTNAKFLRGASILTVFGNKSGRLEHADQLDRRYRFFAAANAKKALEIIEADIVTTVNGVKAGMPMPIMIDNKALENVIYFYSSQVLSISSMPILKCFREMKVLQINGMPNQIGNPISRFFVFKDGLPVSARLVYEGVFHFEVTRRRVRYFIETGQIKGLGSYLETSTAFALVDQSTFNGRTWKIWKVDLNKLSSLDPEVVDSVLYSGTQDRQAENGNPDGKQLIDFVTQCLEDDG